MACLLFNIARICNSQFKCKYLKNEKRFLNFLFHIWILHQVLHILKKMMMVIANVFPKLQTVKDFVTQLCNNGRLGTRLDSRHVKRFQILGKSPWECLYHFFSSIWGKLIWKISPPVLDEISEVFVNIFTANVKYPVQYCEILQFPIQIQVSEKRKTFSQFFVPCLESTSNLTHFEEKDDGHS